MSTMDPVELARWTRFAMKGGIGKCTAICDCVAESSEDLMFLKDDEIVVLLQVTDKEGVYLGYCEDVIGRFNASDVRFHSKLKKPVMAKRQSSTSMSSSSTGLGKSPTPTFTPPSSRLGGAYVTGGSVRVVSSASSGGGGSRGSTPASPFPATIAFPSSTTTTTTTTTAVAPGVSRSNSRSSLVPQRTSLPHQRLESISSSPLASNADSSPQPPSEPNTTTSTTQHVHKASSGSLQKQFELVEEGWKHAFSPSASPAPSPDVHIHVQAHAHLGNRPPPLEILDIDPLRIMKKSPLITPSYSTSSLAFMGPNVAEAEDSPVLPASDTPTDTSSGVLVPNTLTSTLALPSSTSTSTPSTSSPITPMIPGTSYTTSSFNIANRLSTASSSSSGVVGIGLTLLQNLADTMDSDSESGSEYGGPSPNVESHRNSGRVGGGEEGGGIGGGDGVGLIRNASVRSEGTVDGLRYGSSESGNSSDEDEEEDEADDRPSTSTFPMPPTTHPHLSNASSQHGFPPRKDSTNSILSSSSGAGSKFGVQRPGSNASSKVSSSGQRTQQPYDLNALSPNSPTSPGFGQLHHTHNANNNSNTNPRERRPSLAPSLAASTHTTASRSSNRTSSSWGADDIYDDYRYSRFSMSSSVGGSLGRTSGKRASQATVNSLNFSAGGEVPVPVVPPVPERRSLDGGAGERGSAGVSERRSANGNGNAGGSGAGLGVINERLSVNGERDNKRDSDASVYTQASVGLGGDAGLNGDGSLNVIGNGNDNGNGNTTTGNRPPPLNLSLLNPSYKDSILLSQSQPQSQASEISQDSKYSELSQDPRDSRLSQSQPQTNSQPRTSSPSQAETSPLLHATWGSPLSSPGFGTAGTTGQSATFSSPPSGFGSGNGNGVGANTKAVHGMVNVSSGFVLGGEAREGGGELSASGVVGRTGMGIASAMRQRIEDEKLKSPLIGPGAGVFGDSNGNGYVHSSSNEEQGEVSMDLDVSGMGKKIVVEDDEELPSHVTDSYTTVGEGESDATVLYEEDDTVRMRLARKGDLSNETSNENEGSVDMELDDSIGISIPVLPSTPISAAAPPLPPPSSTSTSTPDTSLLSVSSTFDPSVTSTPPSPSSHLRPSLRELREGGTVRVPGTGERRSLFLPHPNAPKAPKELGGLESPGPMYVRERGTPPVTPDAPGFNVVDGRNVGGMSASASVGGNAPGSQGNAGLDPGAGAPTGPYAIQQPGPVPPPNQVYAQPYPYAQPPPPPMIRPTARQVILQALSRPPSAPAPSQPGGPGPANANGQRRPILPRGPTIYGRIEGDFATAMGPIPITWSVDPPPTKARNVPASSVSGGVGVAGQGQGPVQGPGPVQSQGPALVQGQGQGQGQGLNSPHPLSHPHPRIGQGATPPVHSSPLRSGSVPPPSTAPIGIGELGLGKRPSVMSLREGMVGGGFGGSSALNTVSISATASQLSNSTSHSNSSSSNSTAGSGFRSASRSSSLTSAVSAVSGMAGAAGVSGVGGGEENKDEPASKPIPRANFFPKVGAVGARPRSRSFSGLGSADPAINKLDPLSISIPSEIKKSSSVSGSSPTTTTIQGKTVPHRPSPLSLPQNNLTNQRSPTTTTTTIQNGSQPLLRPRISTPVLKSPNSPLARDMTFGQPPAASSGGAGKTMSSPPVSPRKMSFGLPTRLSSSNRPEDSGSSKPKSPPPVISGPTGSVPGAGLHLRRLTSSKSVANLRSESTLSWEEQNGFRPPSISSVTNSISNANSSSTRPVPIPRTTLSPPPLMSALSGSAASSPSSSLNLDLGLGMGASPTFSFPVRKGSGSEFLGSASEDANSVRSGVGMAAGAGETRSQLVTSPTPYTNGSSPLSPTVTRQNSLRTKLSLPNLRRHRSRQDDAMSMDGSQTPNEVLLQVQDMEFELVRPSLNHFTAARSSEDSGVLAREPALESGSSSTAGASGSSSTFLRTDSPAFSTTSETRSPTVEANGPWALNSLSQSYNSPPQPFTSPLHPASSLSGSTDPSTIEAHRNREQKWMSLLSSSPPSQARKLKKVRKLLLEGVPSSVRYLVWSHLTDGKAKSVPGVYAQLCKRGRVPLTEQIEADVSKGKWFLSEERGQLRILKEAGGGIVQLLQAYLNMVPDIQYSKGLPHIVGQLLLLAPEEHAFWIFVSIMDTHIRPYFASGTTQMEVDAALFSRALEANDPAIAKKLFVDMGILPVSICQPWFSSLFVGCLPDEYLARTWDIFLYDGIPFLIRIGLAIVSFVRRQLLECTSEESALAMLHRPPPVRLPPTTENYLSLALSVKLKDDDVRKQRIKMEAQVKRQIQQQAPRAAGSISLPRT